MVVTLDQQYNIGEKPTVMLYTYINRHAGTPDKTKQKHCSVCVAIPFILDVRLVDVPAGVAQDFSFVFLPSTVLALVFNFSREKESAVPFPRRL